MSNPKGKEPESYSSVLKTIQDMGGKKKASALLPAMRTMTKYLHKANSELIEATIHLLQSIRIGKDDNKVTNLIHLFCSQLASSCTAEENLKYANILKEELNSTYFTRVLSAFKAYCVLLKTAGDNENLKAIVLQYATETQNGGAMSTCLGELFCVLRYCDLDCVELDSIIQWGLTTNDPAVLRHCLGMLLSIAADNTERVQALVNPIVSDATIIATISTDSLASSCFVRICWSLYEVTSNNAYLAVLCNVAHQGTEASSLLAMELLCQLPFDKLSKLNEMGGEGNDELISFIATTVQERCASFAAADDNLGLICITRIVIGLSKSLITHFGSRNQISGNDALNATQVALNGIYDTLSTFSNHISIYLKTSVLKVRIWLVNPPEDETATEQYHQLINDTKSLSLPVPIAREVLKQLNSRVISTPSLSHFAVEVAWTWFLQNPLTVTVDGMTTTWHACFSLHDKLNCEYTINKVFRLLDYSTPLEEYHDHLANLKCAAFWFLGECVDFFNMNSKSVDCTSLYQSILIRLQKAATMGDWKTRREAIRSLGKIGLVSEDPIRISIYEMLQNLTTSVSEEEETIYNDLIEPILDVFDLVYEAIEDEQDPAPIIERERVLFHQNVIQ